MNTEPSVLTSGVVSVHESQSMPMDAMAVPRLPSVAPMVSHESYCASGVDTKKSGFTPPTSVPNGAAIWYAAGTFSGRAMLPQIAYTSSAASPSVTLIW